VNQQAAPRWADERTAWWEDTGPVASLDFGLAVTLEDFDAAFRFLHDRYVETGAMAAEASGRRLNLHNLLPSTKVFLARASGRVVGTMTMVEDSRLGLPMDEAFGPELGRLRDRGRRLAEASSLTIDPAWRASGVAILVRLFRLVMLCATRIARADDLCFVVHPRYGGFYGRLFPFRRFRRTATYRRMANRPVIGLRLDLGLVRALFRTESAGLSAGPQTRFMCGPEIYRELMGRLRSELPRSGLTPPEWARLFATDEPADRSAFAAAALASAVNSGTGDSG
jgi:GNAT superfamily N-acetyltransferase